MAKVKRMQPVRLHTNPHYLPVALRIVTQREKRVYGMSVVLRILYKVKQLIVE